MPLGQLLRRQRRPEIGIPLLIQPKHLGFELPGDPPVRRLAPPPMHQPTVSLLPDPLDQPPHLARRAPHHLAGLPLPQGLAHRLPDHMHLLQPLHTHTNRLLSDHTALPVRAVSLYKRTYLLWSKQTFSCWDYRSAASRSGPVGLRCIDVGTSSRSCGEKGDRLLRGSTLLPLLL